MKGAYWGPLLDDMNARLGLYVTFWEDCRSIINHGRCDASPTERVSISMMCHDSSEASLVI
jgi:hypothetical protein